MARVTNAQVKGIIVTTIDTEPFIRSANVFVTNKLTNQGLSDALLTEIELWLAAHFVAIREGKITDETMGDAKVAFERAKMGKGLEATSYGQQALVLDSTGILAQSGKKRAIIQVVGRNE
ncbi:hypothetical protein LCGC14_0717660 [marine sediment metagenome]|uniref:Uncharacterized protein n=1 Tax=marine sediment metagenome TaxID=412755 RepID=A0A0F9SYP5_9ZZZZ